MELVIKSLDKNFVVALLEEKEYGTAVVDFLHKLTAKYKKICYVLLQSPYSEVKEEFKKKKISLESYYFVDILTKHYGSPEDIKNCSFLNGPNIGDILIAIGTAINKHKCQLIIFDNIGSLMSYHPNCEIEKFTNSLKNDNGYTKATKIFFMQKKNELIQEESDKLLNDLQLFADKIIDTSIPNQ